MKIDRAKAQTQAIKAMSMIDKAQLIKSVGTNRNYLACLTHLTQFIKDHHLGDLRQTTKETAVRFLEAKADSYSQKTLDMHRQAFQAFFIARGDLGKNEKLPIVKSHIETVLEHRAYTPEQVNLIIKSMKEKNAFSTILAYRCGLRAHELFTIRKLEEQTPHIRYDAEGKLKNINTKWQGREIGIPYSVVGKGGLIREIRVPEELVVKLEEKRLPSPVRIQDRGIFYESYYNLAGGHAWSSAFSAASKRVLGWSTGAHGLRHSYAQERMDELKESLFYSQQLETVSQELGHFRKDITLVYLR